MKEVKGIAIKEYLKERGMTQTYVSKKTEIPAPILNMMLNDSRKIEVNEYVKICDAIEVPLEQFRKKEK